MDRVAAKVAQKVRMLLENDDVHTGASEEQAQHDSGRAATHNAAPCVQVRSILAPSRGTKDGSNLHARCCVVGGGPAGIMLSLLLARAGVDVVVLEKHADFLRDFRGDTIHPSTLEVMHELGLLDELLTRPHQEIRELGGQVGNELFAVADFRHLPTRCRFVALMPQWDFLDFLVEKAKGYPAFRLEMEAEVTDLIEEEGRIAG